MLTAIHTAHRLNKTVPKPLVTGLRKALHAAGINPRLKRNQGYVDKLLAACQGRKGDRKAIEIFYEYVDSQQP